MADISDIDRLIEDEVRAFEVAELKRRELSREERERVMDETLGPTMEVPKGEAFHIGDAKAGISSKSIWFERRRIHFAVVVSIAVGERRKDDTSTYWVDINCTAKRSYRIALSTILEADNFLVALSQNMSFKIVPTVEEDLKEQMRAEEAAMADRADTNRHKKRMEAIALRQKQLLEDLVQIEAAPTVSFGVIF